jgi:hypothetical protein
MLPVIELLLLFIILSSSFLFTATCRKVDSYLFRSERAMNVALIVASIELRQKEQDAQTEHNEQRTK